MKNIKTEWDLNLILDKSTINDPIKYRAKVKSAWAGFIKKWENDASYLRDPKKLRVALDEYERLCSEVGFYYKEADYWYYLQCLDLNSPKIKAKTKLMNDLMSEIANLVLFFEHKISLIDEKTQQKMLSSEDLKDYKHFLEKAFASGKYLLTEAEEKLLNKVSAYSQEYWTRMVAGMISKEEAVIIDEDNNKVKKSFSEILELINNKNKFVRDLAAEKLNRIFKKHIEIAENEINAVISYKHIIGKERKAPRFDFLRHINDDVDSESVDRLINCVNKRFDISKRFYELKAKLLGVKQLNYHERNIEYSSVHRKYKFEEGYELVKKVFFGLDSKFGEIFTSYFENGQVDVFPKKGKKPGAFCSYGLKNMPVFVFLNHTDSLNNILTMAHEFGHAINFELSRKQNALNFTFPMCTAETASTFFEDFVLEEILKDADDETRLGILMSKLNDDVSVLFRQIAFYKFETELHNMIDQKGYISHAEIGKIFQKHMIAYMGPAVKQNPGSENWWVYISHFRSSFYVYSYAFGLLVSKFLQNIVKKDHNNIQIVKEFFAEGGAKSPKDQLAELGIDISTSKFWETGISEIEELLIETEKLAKKLGKI